MDETDHKVTDTGPTESTSQSAGPPDFRAMASVEELVSAYNEMAITAIDLGVKKVASVSMFVDVAAGVRACEHLHRLIQKARDPKPKVKPRKAKKPSSVAEAHPKSSKEDEVMANTRKSTKKPAKANARKKVSGKTKTAGTRSRIPEDAKIVWTGKENPFRDGSGKHERVEFVKKHSGQTKATILKHKKATSGTIAYCVKEGLAKVAAA